jgi:ribonucleotide reductase class II
MVQFIAAEDVKAAEEKYGVPAYGALGSVVDTRTYLRWLPEQKRRETFYERNARVVNYNVGLAQGLETTEELQEEANLLFDMMNQLLVWGSGRAAWVAGTKATELVPESTMNCSAAIVDRIEVLGEAFHLLCLGCGFGFRIYPDDVSKIPELKNIGQFVVGFDKYEPKKKEARKEKTDAQIVFTEDTYPDNMGVLTIEVGDSREAWVAAIMSLMQLYTGIPETEYFSFGDINISDVNYVKYNFDNVRPEGERIKGFGGIASGPEPLINLLTEYVRIFEEEVVDKKLQPINCLDMLCIMGDVVRSGNVRRSSLIALFHYLDTVVRNAKRGLWTDPKMAHKRYRSMSNNSILYDDDYKPSLEEFKELMTSIRYEGEPGFIRADQHKKRRYAAAKLRRPNDDPENYTKQAGITNPCLTGDMRLQTDKGNLTFDELAKRKDFKILSSSGLYEGTEVWCSGEKEVVAIRLSTGKILKSTPDHRWMTTEGGLEAKDLKSKQLVPCLREPDTNSKYAMYGFIQGDGDTLGDLNWSYNPQKTGRHIYLNQDGVKDQLIGLGFSTNTLPTRTLPTSYTNWSLCQKSSFLCGLYSANGSVLEKAGRITLKSTCLELVEQVQDSLLDDFGITSYITTNKSKEVVFENGCYQCRESYDLNIANYESKLVFFNRIGFLLDYKKELLAAVLLNTSPKVTSVRPLGIQKVYDFTEPLTNWGSVEGFLCHNCGEISLTGGYADLQAGSFCNLVSVPLTEFVTEDKVVNYELLSVALRLVTRFAIRQTLINISLKDWNTTQQKERLIGVDLCGIWEAFDKLGVAVNSETSNSIRSFCKSVVNAEAEYYANKLGVEMPLLTTTGKPNGTYAQLKTISSGCHPPYAPYYIRRIRMAKSDALAQTLIDQGIPYYPETSEWEKYFLSNLSHLIEYDKEGKQLTTVWDMLKVFDDFGKQLPDEIKTVVFEFPVKTNALRPTSEIPAIEQLENYRMQMLHYIEHNQSVTVTVGDDEWDDVAKWMYDNWDDVVGISLLPKFADNVYPLLPYQECDAVEFNRRVAEFPSYPLTVNTELLAKYELKIEEANKDVDDVDVNLAECSTGACPVR